MAYKADLVVTVKQAHFNGTAIAWSAPHNHLVTYSECEILRMTFIGRTMADTLEIIHRYRSDIRFAAEIDTALENVGINPKDKVLYRINVWTEKTPKK